MWVNNYAIFVPISSFILLRTQTIDEHVHFAFSWLLPASKDSEEEEEEISVRHETQPLRDISSFTSRSVAAGGCMIMARKKEIVFVLWSPACPQSVCT